MNGNGHEDRALVLRALSGDEGAYRDLFSRYYGKVMRFCAGYMKGDRDASADAAQEAFIRAFRSLRALKEPERFSSWVFAIAENVCCTHRRRDASRTATAQAYANERFEGPEDENALLRERKIAVVRAEIDAIPNEQQRELLRLYYCDGNVTTRELAERTGTPHGTICVTLGRVRAKIQKRLAAAILRLEEGYDAVQI